MGRASFDLDRFGGRRALSDLVEEVCFAGQDALRLFLSGAAAEAELKSDLSPVTEADRAVEARLRSFFADAFPGSGFLGEETGEAPQAKGALRFIVDPIDGTRAFVRGLPTWSILVGAELDGVPVLGVAHFPATGDLYVGVLGHGAEGNGRPLRVSSVDGLDAAMICHGSLSQFTQEGMGDVLIRLGERTFSQRGFADFDGYRRVLEGKADAMIDPAVKPWDLCAAAVLIREAGGTLTSLTGEDTIYGGGALASNGALHEKLLANIVRVPH